LEFLVHFVGDSHQPLHIGYADDRGGNDVTVNFYGTSTNLHAVWDTGMIERWHDEWTDAVQELEQFMSNNPNVVQEFVSDMNPDDWANESFQYVRSTVYNYTEQNGVPYLYDNYYNANLPVVKLRLIAGGVRLGQLLNTLLVGNSKLKPVKVYMRKN